MSSPDHPICHGHVTNRTISKTHTQRYLKFFLSRMYCGFDRPTDRPNTSEPTIVPQKDNKMFQQDKKPISRWKTQELTTVDRWLRQTQQWTIGKKLLKNKWKPNLLAWPWLNCFSLSAWFRSWSSSKKDSLWTIKNHAVDINVVVIYWWDEAILIGINEMMPRGGYVIMNGWAGLDVVCLSGLTQTNNMVNIGQKSPLNKKFLTSVLFSIYIQSEAE